MNIDMRKNVVPMYNALSRLPLGTVKARGWLFDQLLRSKEGTGGHMDELEPDMIATPFINYSAFKKLPWSDEEADPTFAAGWSSEISGTYWTGLVQLAFTLGDTELIEKAKLWIEGVLKHQEEDGYLGGYPKTTDRNADYNPWGSAWCYRAMLSYYEATGDDRIPDAVHEGLLWFCRHWKEHKTDYVGSIIIEIMVEVYAMTGDMRLIAFCEDWLNWLENNSRWQNKISQYLSDDLPYGSMHVVAYGENVKHPAILYCATGKKEQLRASIKGMRKAVERIVQMTGGPSSCGEYLSPKGAACETEYCNFATFSHSYTWLTMASGEACWGDELERCIFNGAQGARKKDERAIAYFSSPNQLYATRDSGLYAGFPDMGAYAPCYNVACCPNQAVRIMPEFVRSLFLQDNNENLYFYCYGPSEVATKTVALTVETLYPFRDSITVNVHKNEGKDFFLRVPSWCNKPCVLLKGEEMILEKSEGGFVHLNKVPGKGDKLIIQFPMETKIIKIDDSAAASKYPICIERGPLVYALPVPVSWTEYEGKPITPLPDGWSWFEAKPDLSETGEDDPFLGYQKASWMKGIDETLDVSRIKVVETEQKGYVWEKPPVHLEVPLLQIKYAYPHVFRHTTETWETPVISEGQEEICTMIPHGCTNLRITYLPRCVSKDIK